MSLSARAAWSGALKRAIGASLIERSRLGLPVNRHGERLAKHAELASIELVQAGAELAAPQGLATARPSSA